MATKKPLPSGKYWSLIAIKIDHGLVKNLDNLSIGQSVYGIDVSNPEMPTLRAIVIFHRTMTVKEILTAYGHSVIVEPILSNGPGTIRRRILYMKDHLNAVTFNLKNSGRCNPVNPTAKEPGTTEVKLELMDWLKARPTVKEVIASGIRNILNSTQNTTTPV
jgi:hypothetical protein